MTYVDYATETTSELKMQDLIDAKIEVLYDMKVLKKKYGVNKSIISDPREDAVRELLSQCTSRYELDTILYHVVRRDMSLNALLEKGISYLRGGN